jgi:hypothetical protein
LYYAAFVGAQTHSLSILADYSGRLFRPYIAPNSCLRCHSATLEPHYSLLNRRVQRKASKRLRKSQFPRMMGELT